MTRWTFLRHAQSESNASGRLTGQRDVPLSEEGVAQARRARAELADVSFLRAVSSDLARAHRTAEIVLAGRMAFESAVALRERGCGCWEGRPLDDLRESGDMDLLRSWTGSPPGGESLRDAAERALAWFVAEADDRPTLVVAHGALIRALLFALGGRSGDELVAFRLGNCESVTRVVQPSQWRTALACLRR